MLAVAGVAVGHIVGYAVAHPDAAAREAALGGHAYLPAAAATAIPLGVAAALWWAVRTARTLGMGGRIDTRHLAVAQLGVFAVQEVGERLVSGGSAPSLLAERGVWFGVLAQILVAFLVTRALSWAQRIVRSVVAGARTSTALPSDPLIAVLPEPAPILATATVSVGLRAPPRAA